MQILNFKYITSKHFPNILS